MYTNTKPTVRVKPEQRVIDWINSNQSNFAKDLSSQMQRYSGKLTKGQIAAVQRTLDTIKIVPVSVPTAVTIAAPDGESPTMVVDRLMDCFKKASACGLKRPKMIFEGFVASLAPASGANPGAVYIKDTSRRVYGGDDVYVGKIVKGRFITTPDCRPDTLANVQNAMADPLAAAKAYGKRTGNCSCCSRPLTNPESVELGIGPICRDNFGM